MNILRRDVLKNLTGAGAFLTGWAGRSDPLCAGAPAATPNVVQYPAEIEGLVRLMEQTPRERCFEMLAVQLQAGASYRQLLAALFLAGIRNVNPQPPGFKLHCVFVIHSAHQLSLDAPLQERLLPLLWALDYFKQSQERDAAEGDFQLRDVVGPLPPAEKAWDEYHAAMESWDEPRADRAIAALVRTRGAHEVMEGLWRYGARDYRNIGHKAIFAASSWRTLQTIGWQHAEPTLRSLTQGLLDFGVEQRLNGYGFADQSHVANRELAKRTLPKLSGRWTASTLSDATAATKELVAAVREGRAEPACAAAARMLVKEQVGAGAVWDAVHLAAGELMMRLPGILGVHCVTSANALHYAFRVSADAETRLYLLLQAVGWMNQFANFMARDGAIGDFEISGLEGADLAEDPAAGASEILGLVSKDPARAARKAFQYAKLHADAPEFKRAARSLLFAKARESHDFKYAAAIFEDFSLVAPVWRPHMLATATYYLRGSSAPNSKVVERARDVLEAA